MDSSSTSEDSQSWREGESNFSSSTSDSEQLSTSSSQSQDQNILTPQMIENNMRLYYEKVEEESGIKVCKVEGCKKTFTFLSNLIRHCHRAHKKNSQAAIQLNKKSYSQEHHMAICKICNKQLLYKNIGKHINDHIDELKVKSDQPKVKSVVKDETTVPKYNSRDTVAQQIDTIVSEYKDFLSITAKSTQTIKQYSSEVRKILEFWAETGCVKKPYNLWSPKTRLEVPTITSYIKKRVGDSSKKSAIWSYKKVSLYFIYFPIIIISSSCTLYDLLYDLMQHFVGSTIQVLIDFILFYSCWTS